MWDDATCRTIVKCLWHDNDGDLWHDCEKHTWSYIVLACFSIDLCYTLLFWWKKIVRLWDSKTFKAKHWKWIGCWDLRSRRRELLMDGFSIIHGNRSLKTNGKSREHMMKIEVKWEIKWLNTSWMELGIPQTHGFSRLLFLTEFWAQTPAVLLIHLDPPKVTIKLIVSNHNMFSDCITPCS